MPGTFLAVPQVPPEAVVRAAAACVPGAVLACIGLHPASAVTNTSPATTTGTPRTNRVPLATRTALIGRHPPFTRGARQHPAAPLTAATQRSSLARRPASGPGSHRTRQAAADRTALTAGNGRPQEHREGGWVAHHADPADYGISAACGCLGWGIFMRQNVGYLRWLGRGSARQEDR